MAKGHSFLSHKLHSLLGLFPIGLFLLFHLTANYQATHGAEAFNQTVGMIENVPFLTVVEFIFIYLPILFHAVYGIFIAFQAKQNVGNFGYFRNQMFLWQRLTGIITLIFIVWHVWETRVAKALGATVDFDMMHQILSSPMTAELN